MPSLLLFRKRMKRGQIEVNKGCHCHFDDCKEWQIGFVLQLLHSGLIIARLTL